MAKITINVGTTADDGTGDTLRGAFQNVNANFTELYSNVANTANLDLSQYYAANASFSTANLAYDIANLAYAKANSANLLAYQSNNYTVLVGAASNTYADMVGVAANNYTNFLGGIVNTSIGSVHTLSNNAFNQANIVYTLSNNAFYQANLANLKSTISGPYANDTAANTGGVAVLSLYYTSDGNVRIRLV